MPRPFLWLAAPIVFALAASTGSAAELRVGEPFPEISLPKLDGGGSGSIADLRGHKVLLHVWASW